MKILHVIRGLANSSGTTHIVVPLSEEQARQGAEVTVFFVERAGEPAIEPNPELVLSRLFPLSLPLPNPGISLRFARALTLHIQQFDVVHIHAIWNFPTFFAMRTAMKNRIPYMVAPQGSLEPWALRQNRVGKFLYSNMVEAPLFNRAAGFQALTKTEAEQIRSFGITVPIFVIPNGVIGDLVRHPAVSLAKKLGLPTDCKVLLFLSRLHPKKGADLLIRAFAELPDTSGLILVVAGSDGGSGYARALRRLAQTLQLGDRCIFIGEVRGSEKQEVLSGADIFALPSYSEGLPVAVIEAMTAGLPVLITPACNLPEVEEWNAGIIVPPNVLDFSRTILRVSHDLELARQMGLNGKQLVKAKFTWERIARDTFRAYDRMLGAAA